MSIVGSYTDIEKVDMGIVDKRIVELEKKIEDRRKSMISLYNAKLDSVNKIFLEQATKSQQKDDVCLEYLKKVRGLHAEFKEKY